jgi:hypothetical protein
MNRSHRWHRALGVALFAALPALAAIPIASADPGDPPPVDPVSGNAPAPAADPAGADLSPDAHDAVSTACRQFGSALDLAASNYEDFAYATAGSGNAVNYQDPNVLQSNLLGRTALREAAGTALESARTPGLPGDVADPMRTWSLHATKLVLIMGLRGGGDSLNSAATELNTDANNVQMACALNGSRA